MRIPFELKTAQQEALDAAREVYRKAQEAAKEAIERAEKSDGVPVVITFQLPRGGGRVRWTMEFVVGKASVVNDMKAIIFVSATRDTNPPFLPHLAGVLHCACRRVSAYQLRCKPCCAWERN